MLNEQQVREIWQSVQTAKSYAKHHGSEESYIVNCKLDKFLKQILGVESRNSPSNKIDPRERIVQWNKRNLHSRQLEFLRLYPEVNLDIHDRAWVDEQIAIIDPTFLKTKIIGGEKCHIKI